MIVAGILVDYGNCSLFQNYGLVVENLNSVNWGSNYDDKNINDDVESNKETYYLMTFCCIGIYLRLVPIIN